MMKTLSHNDCIKISGGSFALDAGWLIGHIVSGAFCTPHGFSMAITDYFALYAK